MLSHAFSQPLNPLIDDLEMYELRCVCVRERESERERERELCVRESVCVY